MIRPGGPDRSLHFCQLPEKLALLAFTTGLTTGLTLMAACSTPGSVCPYAHTLGELAFANEGQVMVGDVTST